MNEVNIDLLFADEPFLEDAIGRPLFIDGLPVARPEVIVS